MAYAALTTVLAVTLGACATRSRGVRTPGPVTVDVRCSPTKTFINVDPWVVQVVQGDSTSWRLADSATVDSVDLSPKHGGWPLAGNPRHVDKAHPAPSGRATGRKGRYQYTIVAYCGTQDSVVIDPDMEIL